MNSKEEAIASGALKATIHSMKRRAAWNDYNAPRIYMLTLVTLNRRPLFGSLRGDPHLPLYAPGSATVEWSDLGRAIRYEELPKITRYYPMAEVWKLMIMPDHLHIIVNVRESLPKGKLLGDVVAGFKSGCNRAYWRICGIDGENRPGLFEEGYCDKILHDSGQLERWKHYLDDNPRRLMLKKTHPDLFRQRYELIIDGRRCVAIGNPFLMDIPDKMAVVVHRADSADEYDRKERAWMQCGANYGVLVGAFISEREQNVKEAARARGYLIIQLTSDAMTAMYKPGGVDFDACAEGRMLILSPWPDKVANTGLTRQECLTMNTLAEKIAAGLFEKR